MQQPTVKQLVDAGICPTCYNKQHNNCLYGDISKQIIFENDLLECFQLATHEPTVTWQ